MRTPKPKRPKIIRTLMRFGVLTRLANGKYVLKEHAAISSGMGILRDCGVGAARLMSRAKELFLQFCFKWFCKFG
jgi:hypothetical protein